MKTTSFFTLALLLIAAAGQAQQSAAAPDSAQSIAPALPAAIQPPVAEPAVAPAPALAPNSLACQVLTGRVTDPFAYPLTGATVMLRDHSKAFRTDAFSTNAEGEFILTSKQPIPLSTVLEVTAAGYTSFEVPLANCQSLDVTLAPLPGTRFKADGRIKKTAAIGRIR